MNHLFASVYLENNKEFLRQNFTSVATNIQLNKLVVRRLDKDGNLDVFWR